jgi:leukotriene-A4 hydrolase
MKRSVFLSHLLTKTELTCQGSNFLLHLERTVGGLDVFIPYMRDYVKTFNGTSITTEQWKAHLYHYFGSLKNGEEYLQKLGTVDWEGVSVPLAP